MREFLRHASKYPVEDIQAYTSQWVPTPYWIYTEDVVIPDECLSSAATALIDQLGPKGVERVGGEEWWQWRGPSGNLTAEWIEMRRDRKERMQDNNNKRSNRIILYMHGGAYFFGSVETHRYQLQRHARKLKGRVFAPNYRLAPQFPFPCALHDCLAAYLFLLKTYDPSEIIFSGDSAGGGLVLSVLCTLRDRGLPLPAGGILISPWVDLTNSFPSVAADNPLDYLPPSGFRHKPSRAWPPPNVDEILAIKEGARKKKAAATGDPEKQIPDEEDPDVVRAKAETISCVVDSQKIELKNQIHMYATNQMLSHPLVSPIAQPSLGGLPPLFISCGSGEMLRDEQIYVAHKAANPIIYPPSDAILDEHDPNRETLKKYKPTHVQLQIWDDLCHVIPTFGWTRPAKHMYRAIAQFSAWALSRAQNAPIDIMDDSGDNGRDSPDPATTSHKLDQYHRVGKAGDPLPPFQKYMIRQRVDKNGRIFQLDRSTILPILQIPPSKICVVNPDLVKKWLAAEEKWDRKFAKTKRRVQKQITKELAHGFLEIEGESPPATALVARRPAPEQVPQRKTRKSCGMHLWNRWANRHDKKAMEKVDSRKQIVRDSGQASDSAQSQDLPQLPDEKPRSVASGESE